jgi:iron complex transport system substrate-binding protein
VRPLWRSSARLAFGVALVFSLMTPAEATQPVLRSAPAQRIVSLNPSLTAIILALGARDLLVGVDDFSARQQPGLQGVPAVGGLFNPSLESVVALRPDLVVLVPSVEQRDFRRRLDALEIPVSVFANIRFEEVLENIDRLGRLVGREREAAARIEAVTRTRDAVERATVSRPRPRSVLVLQREPIFIVGAGSFIDEMLSWAGGVNLGAEFGEPYPRVSAEWLVAAAPEVLIDFSPEALSGVEYWSRWPSLPAVVNGRVLAIEPEKVTLPGPYLDRALELLATALHGPALAEEVARLRDARVKKPAVTGAARDTTQGSAR